MSESLATDPPGGNRIGRIVSVSGSGAVILLDDSDTTRAPQIGALVKAPTERSVVYALVGEISIPMPAQEQGEREMRVVELDFLGESARDASGRPGAFQRGVSVFPALGSSVHGTDQDDLLRVYAHAGQDGVRIGTIHQDESVPAYIVTDDLLGKHFAILGTTGTGKSCAVALILRAILSRHAHGHILLLDPHNEYSQCFGDAAEVIHPGTLELPYWLLNFEETTQIMISGGAAQLETDGKVLAEAVLAAKKSYIAAGGRDEAVTVDTPVPYRMGDVLRQLDEAMGKLDKPTDIAPYMRLKSRIETLQGDRRFGFMFPRLTVKDNMAAILARILRIPTEGKAVTILDLSGVPSEILNVVVSLLCRMVFDFALWSDRAVPILFVCEEAHRYAPLSVEAGFESTKAILSRIAKEGRKYGVSLCLISQRPSELAPGILSQCNTIFALRLSNQKDQDFVRGTLSDSALGLLDALPSLRNGEAVAVGEGVGVPMRISLDRLPENFRPRSGSAAFSTIWSNDSIGADFLQDIVDRWRRQRR
jgi:hypothetical protein